MILAPLANANTASGAPFRYEASTYGRTRPQIGDEVFNAVPGRLAKPTYVLAQRSARLLSSVSVVYSASEAGPTLSMEAYLFAAQGPPCSEWVGDTLYRSCDGRVHESMCSSFS